VERETTRTATRCSSVRAASGDEPRAGATTTTTTTAPGCHRRPPCATAGGGGTLPATGAAIGLPPPAGRRVPVPRDGQCARPAVDRARASPASLSVDGVSIPFLAEAATRRVRRRGSTAPASRNRCRGLGVTPIEDLPRRGAGARRRRGQNGSSWRRGQRRAEPRGDGQRTAPGRSPRCSPADAAFPRPLEPRPARIVLGKACRSTTANRPVIFNPGLHARPVAPVVPPGTASGGPDYSAGLGATNRAAGRPVSDSSVHEHHDPRPPTRRTVSPRRDDQQVGPAARRRRWRPRGTPSSTISLAIGGASPSARRTSAQAGPLPPPRTTARPHETRRPLDGLLDEGRDQVRRGDADVDAPQVVEHPLVLRVVDPGHDRRGDAELLLGQPTTRRGLSSSSPVTGGPRRRPARRRPRPASPSPRKRSPSNQVTPLRLTGPGGLGDHVLVVVEDRDPRVRAPCSCSAMKRPTLPPPAMTNFAPQCPFLRRPGEGRHRCSGQGEPSRRRCTATSPALGPWCARWGIVAAPHPVDGDDAGRRWASSTVGQWVTGPTSRPSVRSTRQTFAVRVGPLGRASVGDEPAQQPGSVVPRHWWRPS